MPTEKLTYESLTDRLERHFGSEHFYRVSPFFHKIVVTEGIKDFLDTCSCYWLMNEIIYSLAQKSKKLRKPLLDSEFLLVVIRAGKTGRITVEIKEDSNEEPILKKSYKDLCRCIPSTPRGSEYKFYLMSGTILLPSEY